MFTRCVRRVVSLGTACGSDDGLTAPNVSSAPDLPSHLRRGVRARNRPKPKIQVPPSWARRAVAAATKLSRLTTRLSVRANEPK
jgi:hypothetical protein